MPTTSIPRHAFLFVAVLACLLAYPIMNGIRPTAGGIFVIGLFGIVMHGALAMLTAELVWGQASFGGRLSVYGIWTLTGLLCFIMPILGNESEYFWRTGLWDLAVLPALSLCTQAFAWVVRFVGGFVLVQVDGPAAAHDRWSLRDFGIGTAILAAALAGIRLTNFSEDQWLSMVLGLCILPLIFAIPSAFYILLPRRQNFAFIGAAVHYGLILVVMLAVLALGGGILRDPRVLIEFLWVSAMYAAGPMIAFFILRQCGWRLVRT